MGGMDWTNALIAAAWALILGGAGGALTPVGSSSTSASSRRSMLTSTAWFPEVVIAMLEELPPDLRRAGELGRWCSTIEAGRNLLENFYFNPKRYDLAKVGRYKVNKKLEIGRAHV